MDDYDILKFLLDQGPRPLISYIFYTEGIMPCCGKTMFFFRGPCGGDCQNIKCFHCNHKWNICEDSGYIEDIDRELKTQVG